MQLSFYDKVFGRKRNSAVSNRHVFVLLGVYHMNCGLSWNRRIVSIASRSFLFFINIFNNVWDFTIKNAAEIINFHCADSVSLFHTVYCRTADIVFIYKSIGCYILFFKCFPKRFITYQQIHRLLYYMITINGKFLVIKL